MATTYTHKQARPIDANSNGLINPTDLLSLSQSDAERMIRAAYAGSREWTDKNRNGDMRVGAALVSMRVSYGLPRSTIASLSGISMTTITRIELGIRSMSADALTNILTGVRGGIKLLHPGRRAEYDRWMIDFIGMVASVEQEERLGRAERRLKNLGRKKQEDEE